MDGFYGVSAREWDCGGVRLTAVYSRVFMVLWELRDDAEISWFCGVVICLVDRNSARTRRIDE